MRKRLPLSVLAILVALVGPGVNQLHAQGRQLLHQRPPAVVTQLKPLRALAATNQLHLAIGLPLRHADQLETLLQELYDPASPNYRHFLTPQEFTTRFGPTAADYQAVIQFAQTNGLTVTAVHPNRVVLDVAGPVANIESALHLKFQVFPHPHEARNFYAPDASPTLDLNVPVLHISGLDNYSLPHPNSTIKPKLPAAAATPRSGSAPGGAYMGGDFRAAYVPGTTLMGTGQSVGLLQFDGYYAGDITAYASQAGIPAPTLINVAIDGGVSTPGSDNTEVALDIEMAMSMAPGLDAIYVYEAPNPSPWADLLSRMANDNLAKQLSCSWGGGSPDATAEQIFKQMAAQGQSFFNATGDSDAFTGAIDFPSDSTNITQVGGTTLSTTGPGGSYLSETVWNWGLFNGSYVGSSGGSSTYYGIPNYQQGIDLTACHGSTTKRNVPDVALAGDDIYVRYDNGSGDSFGGTSCAAPLWAGFMALINQQATELGRPPLGFINPALYAIGKGSNYPGNFHDIITGNNFSASSPANYSAVPGYDLCTGWGTPVGINLINTLAPPPDSVFIVTNGYTVLTETCGPANGAIDPGEPVTVALSLRNVGALPTANLVATLLATNGIIPTGESEIYYGALAAGGGIASNSFTFTASGPCGSTVTALLQLHDGTNNLGTLPQSFQLGVLIPTNIVLTNLTQLKIPARSDIGPAAPFPSQITVSGLTNPITHVTVTLNGLTHTYPSDIDVLLVGPQGQTVMLMADAGSSFSISDETLTFDDAAANAVPFSSQITSGTYQPSSYAADVFSSPAPAGSYGSSLATFTGQDPNGTWSLYIQDFAGGDVGYLAQGWTLNLATGIRHCCAGGAITADLALGQLATPNLVNLGEPVTLSLPVTNLGPDKADGVTLTNILPAGLAYVSSTPAASSLANDILTFALGSLTNGATATITIQTLATNAGSWASTASIATTTPDLIAANNNQTTYVTVNSPPGISGLADVTIDENTMTGPLAFTIGDAETAASALSLAGSSDNPTLVPATNIVFGGSGTSRTVAITPALNQHGSAHVTITVGDGLASTSATFLLTVNQVNLPPVLTPEPNHFLRAGSTLVFTNTAMDPDLPATTLTFVLTAGAETGASVNAVTGRFFWQTDSTWADSTNAFTVKVTDDGIPPLSDSRTFLVTLTHWPVIEGVAVTNGVTTLKWSALAGETYRLQYKNSLTETNWTDLPGDIPANGDPTTATNAAGTGTQRFYRVMVLP